MSVVWFWYAMSVFNLIVYAATDGLTFIVGTWGCLIIAQVVFLGQKIGPRR